MKRKKKAEKKLVLAKETVRKLEATTLSEVAAGGPTLEYWSCRVCEYCGITEPSNCYTQ